MKGELIERGLNKFYAEAGREILMLVLNGYSTRQICIEELQPRWVGNRLVIEGRIFTVGLPRNAQLVPK